MLGVAARSALALDVGLGRYVLTLIRNAAEAGTLARSCIKALRYPRVYLPLTFTQVWDIGVSSIPLVLLVAMISGPERLSPRRATPRRRRPPARRPPAAGRGRGGPGPRRPPLFGCRAGGSPGRSGPAPRQGQPGRYLRPAGAFGGRYLELTAGRSGEPLQPGDTLAAASVPSLAETFTVLGDRATEVLGRASEVLAPSRVATLDQGLRSLTRTLDNAAAVSASMRSTAVEVHRGLGDGRLEQTAAGLATSSRNLADASVDLRSAAGTLTSILGKIDRGEGSLGRAVNDPTLYDALRGATVRFDSVTRDAQVVVQDAGLLVRDVRDHPRRYVRITLF